MGYEPQEGVDYLVNYYSLVGAVPETEPADLKRLLNEKTLEYHPDRLQGLAPEFQAKGERIAELLNRARGILLNPGSRSDYDAILTEWTGPVSDDGTPIVTMEAYTRGLAAIQDPDELESVFATKRAKVVELRGYKPTRLSLLERMVSEAGDELPDDLRQEYEDALLEADRVLAIDEAERLALLGIDRTGSGYNAKLDYANDVMGELEEARVAEQERRYMVEIGRIPLKLALMSGEAIRTMPVIRDDLLPARPEDVALPSYFDQQADKVHELAKERESILERRLANFVIDYPNAELQVAGHSAVFIGVSKDDGETVWIHVTYDEETDTYPSVDIDHRTQALLDAQEYDEVIANGANVITFKPLEQIDLMTLFNEALSKHFARVRGAW